MKMLANLFSTKCSHCGIKTTPETTWEVKFKSTDGLGTLLMCSKCAKIWEQLQELFKLTDEVEFDD